MQAATARITATVASLPEFVAHRTRIAATWVAMEALEELLRQRDTTIAELERLNVEKDGRISELLSQLDKYKSVLLFAGTPGLPTGVFTVSYTHLTLPTIYSV